MSWYLARRLMASRAGGRPGSVEEDFFVVRAGTLVQAKKEARRFSKKEESRYLNKYGQEVDWRFSALIDTGELESEQFDDGDCLYARAFPRVSRIEERSDDRIRVSGRPRLSADGGWYGAMLLFRTCERPAHEVERLFILRSGSWNDAERKALSVAKQAEDGRHEKLLGLFQVHEILDPEIRSGTEIYSRFYLPSELKPSRQPPREQRLAIPEFVGNRSAAKISA